MARQGRPPKHVAERRRRMTRILLARAQTVHGIRTLAAAARWVQAQDVWGVDFDGYTPGYDHCAEVWAELNPANVDLCATLDQEQVRRTAAEERQAAIVRARETVNRWYSMERSLVVEREAAIEADETRLAKEIEGRIAAAQAARLQGEAELAKATAVLDEDSFESVELRSEVIALLSRYESFFEEPERARIRAIFSAPPNAGAIEDPDLPDYLQ